ncbi:hypothetical protein GCM10029992_38620 [Glycomyces albus]
MSEDALPSGVATGVGSLPGTDIAEAVRIVFGETPEWPHLPELPARGLGADMIGRGARFLEGIPVQRWASAWQIADRPGRDDRRAADFLERDLDALYDVADTTAGPVRLTAVGPMTLAANLWRRTGGAMIADHGAVSDLTSSLTEGLRGFVAAAQARLPRANLSLQLDEPSLPAALAAGSRPSPGSTTTAASTGRTPATGSARSSTAWASRSSSTAAPLTSRCGCWPRPESARSGST